MHSIFRRVNSLSLLSRFDNYMNQNKVTGVKNKTKKQLAINEKLLFYKLWKEIKL